MSEMATPLLTTELHTLHTPRPPIEPVARPLLFERLNAGLSGKLTPVAAPAGFGKTTLVADWVANSLGLSIVSGQIIAYVQGVGGDLFLALFFAAFTFVGLATTGLYFEHYVK